ncbi:MAG: hypothetical protein A2534_00895 [Candidatus Magasanikbacteria bacterium RIFOXYD2_FULL_39_9]|uniref:Uncharacterized protein n=1 Tax=Candidatus Magasanikbacteria bacterium RIFOXYD1_FULL_40_23 TaxID=1798705 RepID=A0A1F6P7H7_9BACT|nr:MAG: hypothetical protein A2563_01005 [Candidatus Magasanikbacteria bacterium RIFOXYD1_FULL_40_23]OGH93542.1 MAG: hypothetical protein A2534_00895 [Candidatus Magasanikbacteria bacterium RIFOXYD2_FULL_39_9]
MIKQKYTLYLAAFLFGGVFGWVLDTTFRSLSVGYYTSGTLIPFFSLIFGTGSVMLYGLFQYRNISFFLSVIIGTALSVLLELGGGSVSRMLLNYRLWDYSANPFNFYGLIDLEHAFYWFLLSVAYKFSMDHSSGLKSRV